MAGVRPCEYMGFNKIEISQPGYRDFKNYNLDPRSQINPNSKIQIRNTGLVIIGHDSTSLKELIGPRGPDPPRCVYQHLDLPVHRVRCLWTV